MKYRKKPVIIEAIKWTGDNTEEIKEFINGSFHGLGFTDNKVNALYIETLEGKMAASIEDYIIKGVRGEFYPCKPDIFEETYDLVEE